MVDGLSNSVPVLAVSITRLCSESHATGRFLGLSHNAGAHASIDDFRGDDESRNWVGDSIDIGHSDCTCIDFLLVLHTER